MSEIKSIESETPAAVAGAAPCSAYWYISYKAVKASPHEIHKATTEHPVDFAARCSSKFTDGPYVILFAMPITKEQYDAYHETPLNG